jgi:hypothetical protein
MDGDKIERQAAQVILDRGVRYKLGEGDITIRPLRFGTLILISQFVAEAGLTMQKIEAGEDDLMRFFADHADLMLKCVAVAELNSKDASDEQIRERTDFYRDALTAYQVYELFAHVLNLSGIQAFTNTIRLLMSIRQTNLSPRVKGS